MRTKIALIVVLASFLAAAALGVSLAGADPLAESAPVDSAATTTTAVPSLQAPACANGIDDDGDGLIDLADPSCLTASGESEAVAPTSSGSDVPAAPAPTPAPSVTAPAAPTKTASSGKLEQGSTIGGSGDESTDVSGGVNHN